MTFTPLKQTKKNAKRIDTDTRFCYRVFKYRSEDLY